MFNEFFIYDMDNDEIIREICTRLKKLRRNCCLSQEELSNMSGVSIATIKRIETHSGQDISMSNMIKLLKSMTRMEGLVHLVPDVPESPFLINSNTGSTKRKRVTRKITDNQ